MANYGDLLFPLIAAERLSAAGISVIPVSPTATRPPYDDAAQPVATPLMLHDRELEVCGILVGGGYILIAQPAGGLPSYAAAGVASHAYPGLWIGAALAAAIRDVPLLWNAPGAPFPFSSRRHAQMVLPAVRACDYLSVRDEPSARMFRAPELPWSIVPDTVLDLPRLWSRDQLLAEHRALLQRKGWPAGTRTLAIHVRSRAMEDAARLAEMLEGLARRHGLVPLLLPLGPELGDLAVVRDLAARMSAPCLVADDLSRLRSVAGAIAGSVLYVGGSFHGYVTAAAYGVPGVLVAVPAHGKFSGLLQHLGRPRDMGRDWPGVLERAQALLSQTRPAEASGAPPSLVPGSVREALDRHWAIMIAALRHPEAGRDRRMAYLRHYLRHGAGDLGSQWLVSPQLAGRDTAAS